MGQGRDGRLGVRLRLVAAGVGTPLGAWTKGNRAGNPVEKERYNRHERLCPGWIGWDWAGRPESENCRSKNLWGAGSTRNEKRSGKNSFLQPADGPYFDEPVPGLSSSRGPTGRRSFGSSEVRSYRGHCAVDEF